MTDSLFQLQFLLRQNIKFIVSYLPHIQFPAVKDSSVYLLLVLIYFDNHQVFLLIINYSCLLPYTIKQMLGLCNQYIFEGGNQTILSNFPVQKFSLVIIQNPTE